MLKNYFRINLRNLKNNKGYTIINILGLATGIAVCLLIFLVISFETSFDNYHKNHNRIYRVLTEYHHADSKDIFYGKGVPFGVPKGLKTSFKQIEEVAPIWGDFNDQLIVLNNSNGTVKKFKEERGVFFTIPAFFNIFDFPLLAGSYETLNDPNNALLTKETAEKYFGDWKNAIGKTLKLNNTNTLKVSGILANVPANTDFQLKVVVSYGTGYTSNFMNSTNWNNTYSNFSCFILLPSNISPVAFNNQLIAFSKKIINLQHDTTGVQLKLFKQKA